MDKINIKVLLNQTFVSEAKVPGLDITNKAKGESGKENKKAIKDMGKELSDYDKESKKETSRSNLLFTSEEKFQRLLVSQKQR
jgi:hypothetical protein